MLIGAIVALWVVATARHALTGIGRARISDRDLHRLVERDPATRRS